MSIIERVSKISLRNMQVGLEVKAQAGGGTMIPITVTGVANVKVSSEPDVHPLVQSVTGLAFRIVPVQNMRVGGRECWIGCHRTFG